MPASQKRQSVLKASDHHVQVLFWYASQPIPPQCTYCVLSPQPPLLTISMMSISGGQGILLLSPGTRSEPAIQKPGHTPKPPGTCERHSKYHSLPLPIWKVSFERSMPLGQN